MKLLHYMMMALGVILTSLFIFPVYLGAINTKLIMAVVGLAPFVLYLLRSMKSRVGKVFNLIFLVLFAGGVSLTSLMAIVINNTNDTTFVSYIYSMLVWLIGAYTLILYLKKIHGELSFEVICMYLVVTGAMQCILALLINSYQGVENFFVRWHLLNSGDVEYARRADRLFGVGCAYDPGGIRLAAISVCAFYFIRSIIERFKLWANLLYIAGIYLILVVGNMISRTTMVGFVIGLLYVFYDSGILGLRIKENYKRPLQLMSWSVIATVLVVVVLYNSNSNFRTNFRFGFEGFVSLVETGEWKVKSNESLKSMYRFPDNMHTWIVGDGYIDSTDKDPYYVGKRYKFYYMATDVGYLRFIYYGGVIMLFSFLAFMAWAAQTCCSYFPRNKQLFGVLYVLQLAVWFKVATDIFCIFAIFIALGIKLEECVNLQLNYKKSDTEDEV